MNVPFVIAQATTPSGVAPGTTPIQTIKIEKPESGQAVVFHLSADGPVKIDFSAIANEKITLVHVGNQLIILFDNNTTATLDNFFDTASNPAPNVYVEVSDGHDLTSTAFASEFPVTTDQSVLPAAGEQGDSGHPFPPPVVDPLAAWGPIPLQPPEELGNWKITTFRINDFINDFPTFDSNPDILLDEDFLDSPFPGNHDLPSASPGDDDGGASFSGIMHYDFHNDGPAATDPLVINTVSLDALGLKSQGDPVVFNWNSTTFTLTGYVDNDGTPGLSGGDKLVLTLKFGPDVLAPGNDHGFTVNLLAPFDDAPGDNENNEILPLNITITDSNGDPISGLVNINVDDDMPAHVADATPIHADVSEGGLSGAVDEPPAGPGGDDNSDGNPGPGETTSSDEASGLTGSLLSLVSFGADQPGTFSISTDTSGLPQLYSHGEQLAYSVDSGTNTLTAATSLGTVFTLHIGADGSWSFDLDDQLDHVTSNGENDDLITSADGSTSVGSIDFSSLIVATDFDSDSVNALLPGDFTVTVKDDIPAVSLRGVEDVAVNENDIFTLTSQGTSPFDGHTEPGTGAAIVTGSLSGLVASGADESLTWGFSSDQQAIAYMESLGLFSKQTALPDNGQSLTYTVTHSGNDVILSAFEPPTPGIPNSGNIVFSFTLDSQSGDFTFRLFDELIHVTDDSTNTDLRSGGPTDGPGGTQASIPYIDFGSIITATDFDGDSVTLTDKVHVTVVDDIPQVHIGVDPFGVVQHDETQGIQRPSFFNPDLADSDTSSPAVKAVFAALEAGGQTGNDPDVPPVSGAIGYAQSILPVVFNTDPFGLNFGADFPPEAVTFSLQATDGTFSGVQTTEGVNVYLYNESGLIVGRLGNDSDATADDPNANGTIAFAIAIEPDGRVDLAQYLSLHHPNTNSDDESISLADGAVSAVLSVTDSDGDTVSDSADISGHIRFDDDGPDVDTNKVVRLDDDVLSGNPGGIGDNVDSLRATGTLAHDYGADGEGTTLLRASGAPAGFTYTLNGDHTVLTISQLQNGNPVDVLKVTLSDTTSGGYLVEQLHAIDHPAGSDENNDVFNVRYRVTDGDGDHVNGTLKINIDDDTPVPVDTTSAAGEVFEDGLTGPSSFGNHEGVPGSQPVSIVITSAQLSSLVSIGADVPGTFGLNSAIAGNVKASDGSDVTSGGVQVKYALAGGDIVGYADANGDNSFGGGDREVFRLHDNGDGSFQFTLEDALDHLPLNAGGGDSETLILNLAAAFQATDHDGDNTPVGGILAVTVENDIPVVASDSTNYATNGDFVQGNWQGPFFWGSFAFPGSVPGWNIGGSPVDPPVSPPDNAVIFERQVDGFLGLSTSDGAGMIDLGASGGNYELSQNVGDGAAPDLHAGEQYVVTFEAGAPFPETALLEVLWNNVVIGTIDTSVSSGELDKYAFTVTGTGDPITDKLTFREIGTGSADLGNDSGGNDLQDERYHGTYIANVQISAVNGEVDEDGLNTPLSHGIGDSTQIGDAPTNSAAVTGALNVLWGADSTDTADAGGVQDGAGSGLTGRTLTFTDNLVESFGTLALKSNGDIVTYVLSENNTVLTGVAGSGATLRDVFTVSLSDDGSGAFTFTLFDQLDHAAGADENDIALKFHFTATDFDGDAASGSFTVGVDDDMPVLVVEQSTQPRLDLNLALDETVQPDNASNPNFDHYNTGELESDGGASNGGADDVVSNVSGPLYNHAPVFDLNPASSQAIGSLTTASGAIASQFNVSASFGADGPGPNGGLSQNLSLLLSGAIAGTNLTATDTGDAHVAGLSVAARAISLYQVSDTVIEGRIAGADGVFDGNGADEYVAFRITLNNASDPSTASITVDQFMAIDHGADDPSVFDENAILRLAGNGTLGLKLDVTATDDDLDPVEQSATLNLANSDGSFISFDDDGPSISGVTQNGLGPELIVNGSFEQGHANLSGSDWDIYSSIPGWTADPATIPFEIQTGGAGGVAPQDGKAVVELDGDTQGNPAHQPPSGTPDPTLTNTVIAQHIGGTEAGHTYQLTFFYSPRLDHAAGDDSGMNVLWNGAVVETIDSTGLSPGFHQFTLTLTGTGNDTLGFQGVGAQDEFGALIDNVSLRATNPVLDDEDTTLSPAIEVQGGPGDDGSGLVATGQIDFDAGTDGLKSIEVHGIDGLKAIYVDASGVGHPESVNYNWVPNPAGGGTLTGSTADLPTVFTLAVDGSGNYTFTLVAPLDHPLTDNLATDTVETSFEDNLNLGFGFTVTDGDNDQATGTIAIDVDDDSPEFVNGGIEDATVAALGTPVTENLNLFFGADGEHDGHGVTITGWPDLPGITTTLSDDGTKLTATIDGTNGDGPDDVLYTLQLNTDGTYTFTQVGTLPGGVSILPTVALSDSYGPDATHDYEGFTLNGLNGGLLNGSGVGVGVNDNDMNAGDQFQIVFDNAMDLAKLGINFAGNGELSLHWIARDENGVEVANGDTAGFNSDGTITIDPSVDFRQLDLQVNLESGNENSPKFKLTGIGGDTEGTNPLDSLTFQATGTDGDGDAVSSAFDVHIDTNTPLTQSGTVTGTVEEEQGLPGGNEDRDDLNGFDTDFSPLVTNSATGSFGSEITGGIDGPLTFAVTSITEGSAVNTVSNGALFSGGKPVLFHEVDAAKLIGYVSSDGTGPFDGTSDTTVFTLTLTDAATGAYTFTLNAPVDHPEHNDEDAIAIDLNGHVTVTDAGGPAGEFPAGDAHVPLNASITVIDDTPNPDVNIQGRVQVGALALDLDETIAPSDPAGEDRYSTTDTLPPDNNGDLDDTGITALTPSDNPADTQAIGELKTAVTNGLGALFFDGADPGADGLASDARALSLVLSGATVATTLTATAVSGTALAGLAAADRFISLVQVDATHIEGRIPGADHALGTGNDDLVVFRIALTGTDPSTAQIQVDQFLPIDHGQDGNAFDSQLPLQLIGDGNLALKLTDTVTDGDGDTVSKSAQVTLISGTAAAQGTSFLSFDDDGPTIAHAAADYSPLVVDESVGADLNDANANDEATVDLPAVLDTYAADHSLTLIGAATQAISAGEVTSFGTDGPAAGGGIVRSFSLVADGSGNPIVDGAPSGLHLVNLGLPIFLFHDGDLIVGRAGFDAQDAEGAFATVAFAISIDPDTGTVSLAQYHALEHGNPGDPDESSLPASLELRVAEHIVATDGDGDSTSAGVNTFIHFNFEDDGPTLAIADTPNSVDETQTINGTYSLVEGSDGVGAPLDVSVGANHQNLSLGGLEHVTFGPADGVFGTLTVNNDGTWTYTADSVSANESFTFTIKATDIDGDSAQDSQTITVDNTGQPVATNASIVADEDDLIAPPAAFAGNNDSAPGDDDQSGLTGSLGSFGPDGAGGVSFAALNGLAVTDTASAAVKSGGSTLHYFWDGVNTLYASIDTSSAALAVSTAVFKVVVDQANANYTFTLLNHLDHVAGGNENNIDIALPFTVSDATPDTATGTLNVSIDDDMPIAVSGTTDEGTVYEDGLTGLSVGNPDPGSNTTTATISAADLASLVSFGADQPGTFTLASAVSGAVKAKNGDTILSKGVEVDYGHDGSDVVGLATDISGTREVFRLHDNGDGTFTFTLEDQIDHIPNLPPDNDTQTLAINLASAFTAADSDGDSVQLSQSTVALNIQDDIPFFDPAASLTVTQLHQTVLGTFAFHVGADEPAHPFSVTPPTIAGVTANTSTDSTTGVITVTGTFDSSGDTFYVLNVNPNGTYSFELDGLPTTTTTLTDVGLNDAFGPTPQRDFGSFTLASDQNVNGSTQGVGVGSNGMGDGEHLTVQFDNPLTVANLGINFNGSGLIILSWKAIDTATGSYESGSGFFLADGTLTVDILGNNAAADLDPNSTDIAHFDKLEISALSPSSAHARISSIGGTEITEDHNVGPFDFVLNATDFDGDHAQTTLSIDAAIDGLPVATDASIVVDEDNLIVPPADFAGNQDLPSASPGDDNPSHLTGHIADFGPDGPGGVSFALDGQTVTDTAGADVKSGGSTLHYFWDGVTNTLFGSTDLTTPGTALATGVFTIAVNQTTGNYTFTLLNHLDHPPGNDENNIDIDVPFTVSDGDPAPDTDGGVLHISIDDDMPVANPDSAETTEGANPTLNAILVLDFSLSMGDVVPGTGGKTRLQLMKTAVSDFLSNTNVTFNQITVYTFGINAALLGQFANPADAASQIAGLNSLSAGTNYQDVVTLIDGNSADGYAQLSHPAASATNLYFLSDGDPTGGTGLTSGQQTAWANFLNDSTSDPDYPPIDKVYAVGFSEINSTNFLGQIAPRAGDTAEIVTDPTTLSATLAGTLPSGVAGNVLTDVPGADHFGADGGHIQSITIDGVTYSYSPGDPTHVTGTDKDGGKLTFYFADDGAHHAGDYSYTAPDNVTGDQTEVFHYVLVDGDGDTAEADLSITVHDTVPMVANDDIVLTNIVDGSDIVIPSPAMLSNDVAGSGPGPLDITSVQDPAGGTVTLGSAIFTPFSTGPQTLIDADFNDNDEGFDYHDDKFKSTNEPNHEDGDRNNNKLQVTLGGSKNQQGPMSGAWEQSFILATAALVTVSFDYALDITKADADENGQVLMSVDGTLHGTGANDYIAQLSGSGSNGSNQDTSGHFEVTLSLGAGNHTLDLGAYMTGEDKINETTVASFDNVHVTAPGHPFSSGSYDYTATDGVTSDDAQVTIAAQAGATVTGTSANEILVGKDGAVEINAAVHSGSTHDADDNQGFSFDYTAGTPGVSITQIQIDVSGIGKFDQNGSSFTARDFDLGSNSDVTPASVTSGDTTVLTLDFNTGDFKVGDQLRFAIDTDDGDHSLDNGGDFGDEGVPFKVTLSDGTILNGVYQSDGDASQATLTGGLGSTLLGEGGDDYLIAGNSNDTLVGGAGADQLQGGAGADHFLYNATNEGLDHILDFNAAEGDVVDILASAFGGGLTAGGDASGIFNSSGDATFTSSAERFHFDTSSHTLLYDADGSGGADSVALAELDNHATLQANNIHLT